jgi:ammonium transporter
MNRLYSAILSLLFLFVAVPTAWADQTSTAADEAKKKEEAEAKKKQDDRKAEIKADPVEAIYKLDKMAEDAKPAVSKADSAWVMMSTALVLFMVPGLALFYGGMVRRKNVLATMMQSMVALSIVGVYWIVIGYSLAFGDPWIQAGDWGSILGFSKELVLLQGVSPTAALPGGTIPVYLHMLFQGMFAIITPALISGAVAERIRFKPYCIFLILWVTFVYCPLAHCVWAMDWDWTNTMHEPPDSKLSSPGSEFVGALGKNKVLDFAGGTVVHIAAGFSALAAIMLLRKRIGYPEHAMHPNSMVLTLTGAGLLWFGWFGFNGGSAGASGELAVCAFAASQAAAAAAGLSWMLIEWLHRGKPTALGLASGIVAGLVAVTPASGFIYPWAGLVIGLLAGLVCYAAVALKPVFKYDDSLDAFGVHGVGGFLGAVLTGFFCTKNVNSAGQNGFFLGSTSGGTVLGINPGQVGIQLMGALVSAGAAFVISLVIVKILDDVMGFSAEASKEVEGLDRSEHGETGFDFGLAATDSVTISPDVEPRAADIPPGQMKRFQVVIDGTPSSDLLQAWSELCQPSADIPSEFKTVYPYLTTVMDNHFQFRGGDPITMRDSLQMLFQKRLHRPLKARIETPNGG